AMISESRAESTIITLWTALSVWTVQGLGGKAASRRLRGIKEERKELPAHGLPFGNGGDTLEERLVGRRLHPIDEDVDDQGAAGAVRLVFVRSVDEERVMERGLAFLELDRHRLEIPFLLRGQHGLDRVHVAREAGDGEELPVVAPGDVVKTAVFLRRVIE